MIRLTSSRVSSETSPRPFMTRETVAIDTPARSAISRMVTRSAIPPLKHVPERFGKSLQRTSVAEGLTRPRKLCKCSGNVFGNRKEPSMRYRPSRWLAAAFAAGCAVPALLVAGAAPAAVYEGSAASSATAAHRCLVMTGSGDPAFTRNFNPYTATGLPSGSFVQGAFYEPLIVTAEGGLKPVPW